MTLVHIVTVTGKPPHTYVFADRDHALALREAVHRVGGEAIVSSERIITAGSEVAALVAAQGVGE